MKTKNKINTRNKKGIEFGFLITMIITIVAFVLIAGTIYRFMSKSDDTAAENLCRDSVLLSVRTAIRVGGEGSDIQLKAAPILCKTIDKKVFGSGDKAREEIQKQIADKIARCWWMFGGGSYEKDIFKTVSGAGGSNHCFTCYTMLVDPSDEFKEGDSISPEAFETYLSSTNYAPDKSYTKYIQQSGSGGLIMGVFGPAGITPNHAYAIAYGTKVNQDCTFCGTIAGAGTAMRVVGGVSTATGIGSVVGIPLLFVGTALTGGGGAGIVYNKIFEPGLDTIYIVDMQDDRLNTLFKNRCTEVKDIEGQ